MFRRCVHFASWSNFYLIFLVSIEPKSCGSTYCFLSHPCLFDAMKSYFLVLHSWSPRRWTSLHYLPIQNLFPFEVAKCNAMQASSIKQMDENEMKAAKKSSKATYLPYLHTKEQNCNKIGIQKFRLSFLYSINILNFVDSIPHIKVAQSGSILR